MLSGMRMYYLETNMYNINLNELSCDEMNYVLLARKTPYRLIIKYLKGYQKKIFISNEENFFKLIKNEFKVTDQELLIRIKQIKKLEKYLETIQDFNREHQENISRIKRKRYTRK